MSVKRPYQIILDDPGSLGYTLRYVGPDYRYGTGGLASQFFDRRMPYSDFRRMYNFDDILAPPDWSPFWNFDYASIERRVSLTLADDIEQWRRDNDRIARARLK